MTASKISKSGIIRVFLLVRDSRTIRAAADPCKCKSQHILFYSQYISEISTSSVTYYYEAIVDLSKPVWRACR